MTHTPHELSEDFPGMAEIIHDLKMTDGEFRWLAEKYHEVNRAVHRAEAKVEPTDQLHEDALRRERMHLKDRIAARIAAASQAGQP